MGTIPRMIATVVLICAAASVAAGQKTPEQADPIAALKGVKAPDRIEIILDAVESKPGFVGDGVCYDGDFTVFAETKAEANVIKKVVSQFAGPPDVRIVGAGVLGTMGPICAGFFVDGISKTKIDIPTLSPLGMVVFGGLLLGMMFVMLRRRGRSAPA